MFEQCVPSAVHSCRSHACRAFHEWVSSKDQTPEVKNLGERFVNMFAHVADRVTSMESVRDAMTLLVYAIVLLGRDKIKLPMFSLNSPVHQHYNDCEWSLCAAEVKHAFAGAAEMLNIHTAVEMKVQVDAEMEYNKNFREQSFSGARQSSGVLDMFLS